MLTQHWTDWFVSYIEAVVIIPMQGDWTNFTDSWYVYLFIAFYHYKHKVIWCGCAYSVSLLQPNHPSSDDDREHRIGDVEQVLKIAQERMHVVCVSGSKQIAFEALDIVLRRRRHQKVPHQSQLYSRPPDMCLTKIDACIIGTLTMALLPTKQFFNDAFPSSVCPSQLISGQQ